MKQDIKSLYLYCMNSKIMMFRKENDLYFTIHIYTRSKNNKTAFTINGKEWYGIELNRKHLISGVNDNNHMDDISDLGIYNEMV